VAGAWRRSIATSAATARKGLCLRLILIKAVAQYHRHIRSVYCWSNVMPTETAVIVVVITALFVSFALTLAWAERRTHGSHR
jgi:hypothetical protein